jgi:GMP synthase (glutamine-hydrolysing)
MTICWNLLVDLNKSEDSIYRLEFIDPVMRLAGDSEIIHIHKFCEKLSREYDRLILCGTPLMDLNQQVPADGHSWIKDFQKPVLGICAGMQFLARAYGGTRVECEQVGLTKIRTTCENPLFSGDFKAYSLHRYSIEAPEGFDIIAKSDRCIQAIAQRKNPHYGVLFHPEVRNQRIIEAFSRL